MTSTTLPDSSNTTLATANNMSDVIQQMILNNLDENGTISDSRTLRDPNGHPLDQQTILGVLKRLEAHEVHTPQSILQLYIPFSNI